MNPSDGAGIALRQLTKRFGTLTAVDAVDLDVGAGEVICLLGPSGCGKTTTLRMIAGLEAVTSGEVHIEGRHANALSARARNVAMVFQFYALYPSLTVAENLAFPLHAERLGRATIDERVGAVAKMLELDGLLARRPSQLAEGEKQRVAVGRAVVRNPTCFLFDEPLSRLDVQLRETMRGQIKEVLSGLNRATVIVTHDQLEALTMADRIAVMRDGVIEQVATPHEIFAAPRNLFVAGFIGTPQMNLLPAEVERVQGDSAWFRVGDQPLRVDFPASATGPAATGELLGMGLPARGLPARGLPARGLPASGTVTLGLRPRSLSLTDTGGEDCLSATVDIVEPMGHETLVHLRDGTSELRVMVGRQERPPEGSATHVRVNARQIHVFGSDTNRIELSARTEPPLESEPGSQS